MHPPAAGINVAGIKHMDLVASAREANVEEPSALAASSRPFIAPWQTSKVETDHNHDVIFAPLRRVKRQEVEVQWRAIPPAKTCQIEIGNRASDSEGCCHPVHLLALVGEAGLASHQCVKHPRPKRRHEIPSEPRLGAKRPEKLR